MGLLPRLTLYPRNSKPCRTCTIHVFCGLMVTPSSFKTRLAASNAARASTADAQVTTQSSAYLRELIAFASHLPTKRCQENITEQRRYSALRRPPLRREEMALSVAARCQHRLNEAQVKSRWHESATDCLSRKLLPSRIWRDLWIDPGSGKPTLVWRKDSATKRRTVTRLGS